MLALLVCIEVQKYIQRLQEPLCAFGQQSPIINVVGLFYCLLGRYKIY
nr:MAG TPA: hypothetical protein [Caudoviricetes sp.]